MEDAGRARSGRRHDDAPAAAWRSAMPDEVLGEVRLAAPTAHSARLLPGRRVPARRASALTPRDLDGYAVTIGPGSFTGLRVGISTVQGLALASGRPCLGVSALDVLARACAELAPHARGDDRRLPRRGLRRALRRSGAPARGAALRIAPEAFLARVPPRRGVRGRRRRALPRTRARRAHARRRASRSASLFLAGTLGALAADAARGGRGRPAPRRCARSTCARPTSGERPS